MAGTSASQPLDFPKFDGSGPFYWLFRAEQFFAYSDMPEDQHLVIAAASMSGSAESWFQTMQKQQAFTSWSDLAKLVEDHFVWSRLDRISEAPSPMVAEFIGKDETELIVEGAQVKLDIVVDDDAAEVLEAESAPSHRSNNVADSTGIDATDSESNNYDENKTYWEMMRRDLLQTPAGDGKQATESDGNDQADSEDASMADGSRKFGNVADFTDGDVSDAESHSEEDDAFTNSSTEKIDVAKSISAHKREVVCDDQGYDFQISSDLDIFVIPTELQMDGNRAERQLIGLLETHALIIRIANIDCKCKDFTFSFDSEVAEIIGLDGCVIICGCCDEQITDEEIISFSPIAFDCSVLVGMQFIEVFELIVHSGINSSVLDCHPPKQIKEYELVVCLVTKDLIIASYFSPLDDLNSDCGGSITKEKCCMLGISHLGGLFFNKATCGFGLIDVESSKRINTCVVMTYHSLQCDNILLKEHWSCSYAGLVLKSHHHMASFLGEDNYGLPGLSYEERRSMDRLVLQLLMYFEGTKAIVASLQGGIKVVIIVAKFLIYPFDPGGCIFHEFTNNASLHKTMFGILLIWGAAANNFILVRASSIINSCAYLAAILPTRVIVICGVTHFINSWIFLWYFEAIAMVMTRDNFSSFNVICNLFSVLNYKGLPTHALMDIWEVCFMSNINLEDKVVLMG